MKWLYYHKSTINADTTVHSTEKILERSRSVEGNNPQTLTWAFALDADMTSGWKYVEENIEDYDGVLIEYINFPDQKHDPVGTMRAEHCRKHNPNIVIAASWDSWLPRPGEYFQGGYGKDKHHTGRIGGVNVADLIFTTSNCWESSDSGRSMMWNDLFNTDKFCCLLAPFDIEYLQTLQVPYGEREKHIITAAPVNYWHTNEESARVIREFLPSGWKAGLTHTRNRPNPPPYEKLGVLPWWDYVKKIASSYMGVFNARGGGLASMSGMGAVLKTPSVGSLTADYIVACFPDLVRGLNDYGGQAQLCSRLINDESFWHEMTEKGFKLCQENFSFEGAKRNLYNELKRKDII